MPNSDQGGARRIGGALAVALAGLAAAGGAPAAAHPKDPLYIEVPSQPRLPNSTRPILYTCDDLEDCNAEATAFCAEFEYAKGRVLFKTLPEGVRPFPIYSVICFE